MRQIDPLGPASDPPLIGVTGGRGRTSRVVGLPELLLGGAVDLHHVPYVAAIAAAGGLPVQLPREADPAAVVARLDGLVVAGGDDIDPRRYGLVPGSATTAIDPERDAHESALIAAALDHGLPLLGVCRGCQLLNVVRGGTLVLDLPHDVGEAHGQLAYPLHARVHGLRIDPTDELAELLPADVLVNSFHHQAVDRPGDGVTTIATAPDGVCEAIRVGPRALGVQWHPEYLREQPDPMFSWLVREARRADTQRETQHDVPTAV
ncbi:gamma-glutamyl-gamma-aminobutyrate hydrolase family protein [Patulibacter defluvii]|uniref:gamma-glutamyl-gamma-aminobutyrate hydrolase family protein n=1 Tax=Patulibacter defluvii TaxID=3095358 RepID=UPI002A75CF9B|nr:gamma-glutamyl-gamma-aminobutyrate hydrolase family protein [Patulibacter sp. DM4]